jgi:hypothetical protein
MRVQRSAEAEAYVYKSAFQTMTAAGSEYAARRITAAVRTIIRVESVVDVGCARGTWLRAWRKQAVEDVIGVDGDYVDRRTLEIDPKPFVVADLAARLPSDAGSILRRALRWPSSCHPRALLRSSGACSCRALFGRGSWTGWRASFERTAPRSYRYNLLLYVRCNNLHQIAVFARQFQLSDQEKVPDKSSLSYRIRKEIVRRLPPSLCDQFA